MEKFYLTRDMRLENETFIERYKKRHGSERYDFSKTKYESMRRPVTVTCKLHGDFEGLPQHMLKKNFCADCRKDDSINKINNTLKELNSNFIVLKEGFIKSTKPAKFVCTITKKESIKIPYRYISFLKERINFLKQKEEIIKNKFNSNEISLNYRLEESNLISFNCTKHNITKKISYKKIIETDNLNLLVDGICFLCKKERFIKEKLEKLESILKLKFKNINTEKISIEGKEVKKIYCEFHKIEFNTNFYRLINNKQNPCIHCRDKEKRIKILYPEKYEILKKEWDYEINSQTPDNWVLKHKENLNWICNQCSNRYKATFSKKINNFNACPNCNQSTSSRIERLIFYYINKIFENAKNNEYYFSEVNKENNFSYDIMINDLDPKLIIEYDGSFFHDDKINFDKKKTKKILKQGFKCLRIREVPLINIQKHDIPYIFVDYNSSIFEENFKWLLNEIFNFLKKNYVLKNEVLEKINNLLGAELDYKLIPNDYFIFPYQEKNLEQKYPELLKYWNYDLNNLKPQQISNSSVSLFYWNCVCGNTYQKTIKSQLFSIERKKNNCNSCSKNKKELEKELKLKIKKDKKQKERISKEIYRNQKLIIKCKNCKQTKQTKRKYHIYKKNKTFLCPKCKKYDEFEKMVNEYPNPKHFIEFKKNLKNPRF